MSSNKKLKVRHDSEPTAVGAVADQSGGDKPRADEVEQSCVCVTTLPPICWGKVLDVLPYQDVRTMFLVAKFFLSEVCPELTTLNILEPRELDVPTARKRFGNSTITEVNILSLFKTDWYGGYDDIFSIEGAARIVPFLVLFNKLKKAFIGGRLLRAGREKLLLHDRRNVTLADQGEFHGLLQALGGAFATRALSSDLDIYVIVDHHSYRHDDTPSECRACRNICATFPIKYIMGLNCRTTEWAGLQKDLCISQEDYCAIVKQRMNFSKIPKSLINDRFSDVLFGSVSRKKLDVAYEKDLHDLDLQATASAEQAEAERGFCTKMAKLGAHLDDYDTILYVTPEGFRAIQAMVDGFDCNPLAMSKDNDIVFDAFYALTSDRPVWLKSSFEHLVGMGFYFDCDCILVDPADYPCLQRYNWEEDEY